MEDKEFDKYIKDKLSQSLSEQGSDWDAMHQILVDEHILEEDIADDLFDSSLKEQIHKARAPYNNAHWEQLREKLLTEKFLRKRLAIVKTIEIAMLFLLMFTTLSVVPFKTDLYVIQKYKPLVEQVVALVSEGAEKVVQLFSKSDDDIVKANRTEVVISDNANKTVPYVTNLNPAHLESFISSQKDIDKIKNIELLPIESSNRSIAAPQAYVDIDLESTADKELNLVISAGASVNDIRAPFLNEVGISGQKYTDVGQHISVTVGKKKGRNEFYTGLGYSDVSYGPSISDGYFDTFDGENMPLSEINDISYHFINIPLGYRYHFVEADKWSAYASAGTNVGLLAMAIYDFRELSKTEIKLLNQEGGFAGSRNGNLHSDLGNGFASGILQGGSILRNFNITASIGIGVIRKLSDHVGLQIEPSYTRSFALDGIGALEEDINNFRLDVGLRVRL